MKGLKLPSIGMKTLSFVVTFHSFVGYKPALVKRHLRTHATLTYSHRCDLFHTHRNRNSRTAHTRIKFCIHQHYDNVDDGELDQWFRHRPNGFGSRIDKCDLVSG